MFNNSSFFSVLKDDVLFNFADRTFRPSRSVFQLRTCPVEQGRGPVNEKSRGLRSSLHSRRKENFHSGIQL
jgi:hypothetical protein